MRVILFGLGSIGKRHAQVLLDNFSHELVAFRSQSDKKENSLGIKEIFSWPEVERIKPDIAFIVNPTFLHIETALKCAGLGMHIFIEKPLSNNLENILDLEKMCKAKGLKCYVAYNMRFHPVIQKMKSILKGKEIYHGRIVCSSYLPNWRPETNHLKNYSASSSQGGGVLLDLSHEFDYIEYLFGRIITLDGKAGRVSDVTVDAEDYADLIVGLDKEVTVNLHLNFMSMAEERKIVIDYKAGYCLGDLIKNNIVWKDGGREDYVNFEFERNDIYREQAKYFFDNLNASYMMNDLGESKILLEKILEFKNG